MDPRCLDSFIEDCLVTTDTDRVQLAFPPSIEALIYRTFPLDLHPFRSRRMGQYELPARAEPWGWLLYSKAHSTISAGDVAYLRRRLRSLRFSSFDQVFCILAMSPSRARRGIFGTRDDKGVWLLKGGAGPQGHFWPLQDPDGFARHVQGLINDAV